MYMKNKILLIICLLFTLSSYAQNDRSYIKNSISKWGVCRNVAITDSGGDVALNYNNQYSYSGIPKGLADAIKELHDDGELIDDIQLTEGGSWLVLYGDNGFVWNNIPKSLENTIREFNNNHETVTSVTFNDKGGWIVISTDHIRASSSDVNGWIKEGLNMYGGLWAAHMTNDGLALCFEEGYKFMGMVPQKLKNALKESHLNVFRLKFTSQGSYFFADKNGKFSYYM